MTRRAIVGAQIFDGAELRDAAVLIDGKRPEILAPANVPRDVVVCTLDGGILMPGFVDLQVNGGGGAMLGDAPTLDGIKTIAAAHWDLGTRAFLPTLITDTPEKTAQTVEATVAAIEAGVPGVVGLHLEGPHLDPVRAGVHDTGLIRPMTEADAALLLDAAERLPNLMVTLAPESVSLRQIKRLSAAGIIVSLGHSDADYDTAMRAFEAGATCATHLFNAMSPMTSRAPGLVGAALDAHGVSAGLIADGVHVHPATIRNVLGAKDQGAGDVFLVTDAMACAGTEMDRFMLQGREILRRDGRLTLADGTLAGADLSMAEALRVMIEDVGEPPAQALPRATDTPAALLRNPLGVGCWPETLDGLIYLSDAFDVQAATDLIEH